MYDVSISCLCFYHIVIYEAPEVPVVTSVVSVDFSSTVHGYHQLIVTINVRSCLIIMSINVYGSFVSSKKNTE